MSQHIFIIIISIFCVVGCNFTELDNNTSENNIISQSNNSNNEKENIFEVGFDQKEEDISIIDESDEVCFDPNKPCHHKDKKFDDWELSFKMPAKLKPNTLYSSEPFYALILKAYDYEEDCDDGEYIEFIERERREEQSNQLERKVFAYYSCPNMSAVNYDFDGKMDQTGEKQIINNFMALYAGKNKTEAEEALKLIQNDYPQAQLKLMTASYEIIEQ